jgi:tetratricopeptide (TPR) repeat protein
VNPVALFREHDHGPLRFALAAVVVALVVASSPFGAPVRSVVAIALLIGVPAVALRLYAAGPAFALFAALGAWVAFRPSFETGAQDVPVQLAWRLAYIAAPALVLGLALAHRDRERLRLGPLHLYGPAVVMALAAIVHLFGRERTAAHEAEIAQPLTIYALCYTALIAVAMVLRLQSAPAAVARKETATLARGEELEEQGRHALASRAYEREGQLDRAADSAERAGDWSRAARLNKVNGQDFRAGEMYARAQMWPEALDCYERSRSYAAAARVCVQIGDVDRAAEILEKAGDRAGAIKVLEEGGRTPTSEQYMKAGMAARAAAVHEEVGAYARAADVYEHKLNDRDKAAGLHLKAGDFLKAGQLLESLGRKQEALEAYSAVPAGAVDAARMFLAANQPERAAQMLARLPPEQLALLEDEPTLAVVARVMIDSGRNDDAVRILQGLKRRGSASGIVRLLLGRAFLNNGLLELAEEELRIAADMPLEPEEEMKAGYLLGCVLETRGKVDDALRAFHEIMQKDLHYMDVQSRYVRLKARIAESSAG